MCTIGESSSHELGEDEDADADEDEEEAAAAAAAEARMQSVQRGFAAAKAAGVPAAARLMKELRAVCMSTTFEVNLVEVALLQPSTVAAVATFACTTPATSAA